MMYRTCTVQTNLDFSSEADMVKKLRVSVALQPVGDRPVRQFAVHGRQAQRLPVVPLGNLARYRQCALRHDSLGVRGRHGVRALGRLRARRADVFRQARRRAISTSPDRRSAISSTAGTPALPGERPTLSDWANHLSTIFPEVRLKRYLEMRGADGVPWGRLPALPAFWVGLLYDDTSLDAAWDIVKGWTARGAPGVARRRAAPRLQGAGSGIAICSRSPRNA